MKIKIKIQCNQLALHVNNLHLHLEHGPNSAQLEIKLIKVDERIRQLNKQQTVIMNEQVSK